MSRDPLNYIERVASEIRAATPATALPDGPIDRLFLLYAVLALVKGENVTRADVHHAWSAWMAEIDPSHESIRPFEKLPPDVKGEDDPYVIAIRAVARSLRDD